VDRRRVFKGTFEGGPSFFVSLFEGELAPDYPIVDPVSLVSKPVGVNSADTAAVSQAMHELSHVGVGRRLSNSRTVQQVVVKLPLFSNPRHDSLGHTFQQHPRLSLFHPSLSGFSAEEEESHQGKASFKLCWLCKI